MGRKNRRIEWQPGMSRMAEKWAEKHNEGIDPYPSFPLGKGRRPRSPKAQKSILNKTWKNRSDYHNRRARKAKARGTVSPTQLRRIVTRDQSACVYCGIELDFTRLAFDPRDTTAPSFDHVISLSHGGPHVPENLVCCCTGCNNAKNNYDEKVRAGKRPPRTTPRSLRFDAVREQVVKSLAAE